MKIERNLVLFSLIFISSCTTPSDYFNRPNVIPTINSVGTGFRGGIEIDTTNFICVDPKEYETIQLYFEDIEFRLYKCLRFGRCK
jgi:hypothetical protein